MTLQISVSQYPVYRWQCGIGAATTMIRAVYRVVRCSGSQARYFQSVLAALAMLLTLSDSVSAQTASASSLNEINNSAAASSGVSSAQASGGNANLDVNVVHEQNFHPAKELPPAPSGIAPGIPTPNIFQGLTLPSSAKGIETALTYFDACSPGAAHQVQKSGASGTTRVTFLAHEQYLEHAANNKSVAVEDVDIVFPREPGRYTCLGIMNVESHKKKAKKTFMFTVINDALRFVREHLEGYPNLNLLCTRASIAANIGIGTGGLSGALSPGVSDVNSGGLLRSLLGGITGGSGRTFPEAQIGLTCIVAANGGETVIDLARLNAGPIDYPRINGGNGGKTAKKAVGSSTLNNK